MPEACGRVKRESGHLAARRQYTIQVYKYNCVRKCAAGLYVTRASIIELHASTPSDVELGLARGLCALSALKLYTHAHIHLTCSV